MNVPRAIPVTKLNPAKRHAASNIHAQLHLGWDVRVVLPWRPGWQITIVPHAIRGMNYKTGRRRVVKYTRVAQAPFQIVPRAWPLQTDKLMITARHVTVGIT